MSKKYFTFKIVTCLTLLRIGRTGRKNNSGTAYTFMTEKNSKSAGPMIKILTEAKQVIIISNHKLSAFILKK